MKQLTTLFLAAVAVAFLVAANAPVKPAKNATSTVEAAVGGKPMATLNGKRNTTMHKREVMNAKALRVIGCGPKMKVSEFKFSYVEPGSKGKAVITLTSENGLFTSKMRKKIGELPAGSILYFEGIKIKAPEGEPRKVDGFKITLA